VKTAGIIGGVGPESTVAYYRLLIALYRAQKTDGSYPSIIINSIDLNKVVQLITASRFADITDYLALEVNKLANAGVDFGAISANTPHVVFNDLRARSQIPLISIVETTCDAARELSMERVGLLGTRFTMQGRFYREVFEKAGIDLVVPTLHEQEYIHDKYMNELVNGIFSPDTRTHFIKIAERLRIQGHIDGLILGGTELPLLLKADDYEDLPLLDTTRLHVERIVQKLLQT